MDSGISIIISFLIFYTNSIFVILTTLTTIVFLVQCAQKVKPVSPAGKKTPITTTTTATPPTVVAATTSDPSKVSVKKAETDNSKVSSPLTPPSKKRSGTSQKSAKNIMMDSIRIMRGKKNTKAAKTLAAKNPDSDSQHTELINVPIGKAAENNPSINKLTNSKEMKINENPGTNKKVTFSTNIARTNLKTPPSTSTAPVQS